MPELVHGNCVAGSPCLSGCFSHGGPTRLKRVIFTRCALWAATAACSSIASLPIACRLRRKWASKRRQRNKNSRQQRRSLFWVSAEFRQDIICAQNVSERAPDHPRRRRQDQAGHCGKDAERIAPDEACRNKRHPSWSPASGSGRSRISTRLSPGRSAAPIPCRDRAKSKSGRCTRWRICVETAAPRDNGNPARITSTRAKPGSRQEVAETPPPGSNWPCARPQLCHGDAGDREQPTDNQPRGHAVAKEQHARHQGEHRKQQTERRDAAHRATGDQPEPEAEPSNSSDENRVGERQPTAFIPATRLASCPCSSSNDINKTCGTVSSDDHPINIRGSKGP